MKRVIILAAALTAASCAFAQPAGTGPAQHQGHAHIHAAPRGGTLIVLAEEFLNMELVLDAAEGKLSAYILDDHAENPVRIAQKEIAIDLSSPKGKSTTATLLLKAVENPLTGEKVGNTSEFAAPVSQLKGAKQFKGTVREIIARGSKLKNVPVSFP